MIKKLTLLSVFSLVFLGSCYYDNEEELYPFDNCDIPDPVSYSMDVEPIISNSCAVSGCHVQGGDGNGIFTSYDGVAAKIENGNGPFSTRVFEVGDMAGPQNGNLSDCEVEILRNWVEQGAPNN